MESNLTDGCLNDDTLGPVVFGCRDDFDFTVKFEQSILSIVPSACFAALAVVRIAWLYRRPPAFVPHHFRAIKLSAIGIYAALQLALLILNIHELNHGSTTTIAAASLSLLNSLLFLCLSTIEGSRSQRPSILFNSYLLLSLLFDAVQSRTLWLGQGDSYIAKVFTASLGVKVAILVLESQRRNKELGEKVSSPEKTSGIFSLSFFFWMNDLVLGGYRKILVVQDLYALDPKLSAEAHQDVFWNNWIQTTGGKQRMVRTIWKTLKWQFLAPVLPRIAIGGFAFSQPFLINSILNYLQQPFEDRSRNVGYGFIGATFLAYTGLAVLNGLYQYLYQRCLSMAGACLLTAVYRTTTILPSYGKDNTASVTLMNSDVNYIKGGFQDIHECWATLIEVAIACWLLEKQLGAAFVAPLAVVMLCGAASFGMGRFTGKRMGHVMKMTQRRVSLVTNVISNMTSLKLSGLAGPIERLVQSHREDELNAFRRFRMLTCFSAVIAYTPLMVSPVVTFGATSQELTVTRVFTSLAYIQLLCNPLVGLFQTIPQILAAFTCLKRVENFLETHTKANIADEKLESSGEGQEAQQEQHPVLITDANTPSISISHGVYGWEAGAATLENINIEFPGSKLTMVVGPVASGKSTLCKALLGEVPQHEGTIVPLQNTLRTSFCDQTPFLVDATLRENIIGFSDIDEEWYTRVLQATDLREDIASFPDGDRSVVGTNGISLSGGQRQRVAIARALFSKPQFAIFDDVLSGLDMKTREHVFQRVFSSSGLLREIGATVILCTHSTRFLPSANHVVALGNGMIAEQGTFDDLASRNGYIRRLGIAEDQEGFHDDLADLDGRGDPKAPASKVSAQDREDQARQLGDFAIYKHYISHIRRLYFAIYLISGLAIGFLYNFNNIWLEYWSSSIQSGEKRFEFRLGIYILIQVGCLAIMTAFFGIWDTVITPLANSALHLRALKTLMRAPLAYFTSVEVGVTINHFSQDMAIVDSELANAFSNTLATGLVVLGQAAVIGAASPYVMIGYPALIGVLYVIQKVYLRTSRQLRFLELEGKAPLYTHFLETINGLVTIRTFGWVSQNIAVNNRRFNESQRSMYLFKMIQQWLKMVLDMTIMALAVVFVALATQLNVSSPGFTGVGLVSLMSFGFMLGNLIRSYTYLETATSALSRLKSFSDEVIDEEAESANQHSAPGNWPSQGKIEISNVTARYEKLSGTDRLGHSEGLNESEAETHVLHEISLFVSAGEKILICGRTGSGKSSLVLLLQRFLNPTPDSGEILIDGVPLHTISRRTLRERVIALPQSPFLLSEGSSVRDNVDLRNDQGINQTRDNYCINALKSVDLWDVVQERGGLASELRADSLSKGQQQLFCLARAVLRKRLAEENRAEPGGGILLLDEFSANVDADTDRLMQDVIKKEFAKYTTICVAHRLDSVLDYDRVVVMDKGKVVETGEITELKNQGGSKFRELLFIREDADSSSSKGQGDVGGISGARAA